MQETKLLKAPKTEKLRKNQRKSWLKEGID